MLVCYDRNKAKSRRIASAFAIGCGGQLVEASGLDVRGKDIAFYGLSSGTIPLYTSREKAKSFRYIDNAYFDGQRGTHFRVTLGALQCSLLQQPNFQRLKSSGIEIQPWKKTGKNVLLVVQSDEYMRLVAKQQSEIWTTSVMKLIRKNTDRSLVIMPWVRDKIRAATIFAEALNDAWAVVVHSSSAGCEALRRGIPVFALEGCAASPLALNDLRLLESPFYPENREDWAAGLVNCQWTLEEFKEGKFLHGNG